jgi:pimeloyl-ACP methyl ester carboxylesterase
MQWLLPAVIVVSVGAVILVTHSGPAPLSGAAPETGQTINVLEPIELGGERQWISIRGHDVHNPILLYLHPGPGTADLALLRHQCPELERHFVVVNWDQRSAGKSFRLNANSADLTLKQLQEDTHQLIAYLKQRFGVEKIYLLGFSWGTVLGLTSAAQYPDDLYAYISVSQLVQGAEGERLGLEYAQRVAQETQHEAASRELAHIDPTYRSDDWYAQLKTQRQWLTKFGGVYHSADNDSREIWLLLRAEEYSLVETVPWLLGSDRSLRQLWPEVMQVDFTQTVPQVNVPIYFFAGRYDYNTPSALTEAYFNALIAPRGKELIWFEDSAHHLFFDQPEKLAQEIIRVKDEQQRGETR